MAPSPSATLGNHGGKKHKYRTHSVTNAADVEDIAALLNSLTKDLERPKKLSFKVDTTWFTRR